ncbi:MAG: protein-tyrosine phosphatase family protein, partial [Ktedonobacterales bacterium]
MYEEETARGHDIVLALHLIRIEGDLEERVVGGVPCATAPARRIPARLRFPAGEWLSRTGVFERLDEQPPESSARQLFGVSRYRSPTSGEFYWIMTGTAEPGDMTLRAAGSVLEVDDGPGELIEIVRRWSNPPPAAPGLMPHRPVLHRRYGGDPITIHLGRRMLRNRLFIGGLSHQREKRPAVDSVVNLCGVANPWIATAGAHASDRYACKGEGPLGMDAGELLDEAAWVVERLRGGKRVLVHCYAGMNRSTTVCCAALMMLEGISAEAALARVRERHPLAWPDPYHWFVLQWISRTGAGVSLPETSSNASEREAYSLVRSSAS